MDIRECDDDMLIEELANRGIDARTLREFSNEELFDEITRRRKELDKTIVSIKQQSDIKQLRDFTYKQLQDDLDRRDNEREIDIQARHDAEMAEEDAKAQSEAEAIAEDNARAEQEQAEAAQAEYEAEMAR